MMELWEMQSTSSLPLLPGPLWRRTVVPDWILLMGQIERLTFKLSAKKDLCYIELLENELLDHLTVCKQMMMLNWCLIASLEPYHQIV